MKSQALVDPVLASAVNDGIRVLSEAQKDKLLKSASLQKMLSSKRLRHQLKVIDESEKRQKVLSDFRSNNEEIRLFVDELLNVVNNV